MKSLIKEIVVENRAKLTYIIFFLLYVIVLSLSPERYYPFLPTLFFLYPDSKEESLIVEKMMNERTREDEEFFYLTNTNVTSVFKKALPFMRESDIMDMEFSYYQFYMLLKVLYNRPRPSQVNDNIQPLSIRTARTGAYPAGHALGAYYIAKKVSEKYPHLKNLVDDIARRCDECRVKAGLHYPSDGVFSKQIINILP